MLEKFLNVGILKEPVNWVIVVLMVAIAWLAIPLIFPVTMPTAQKD